ncbi:MAG: TonB-dependent receptor [Alphaproteobacteria bacterium]|nr:TonB-dependent receptor [Alphaproteobacteria bacterium]
MNKPTPLIALFAMLVATPIVAVAEDELVVTATRTAQVKLSHPSNIASLNPQDHLSLFPTDILNAAAGVQVQRGGGQEHLTAIRSPVFVGGAGAGSFLYLEDGIAMRAPAFANVNALMDAIPELSNKVEIIRGPGSALYGSNAVHGLVNFIGGNINESGNEISVAGGSYGRYQVIAKHSLRGKNAARRIGIVFSGDAEGYRADSGFEQQKIKMEGAWTQGATTYHFAVAGMNLNQETAGYAIAYGDLEDTSDATNLPLGCQAPNLAPAYEIESCAKSNPNPEAYRDARAVRSYLRIAHTLDSGATLTLTPYMRDNNMQFLMHFLPTQPIEKNAHSSIGIQSSYAASATLADYIVGLDIEHSWGSLSEIQSTPADRFNNYLLGTHYDYDVRAAVIAPYVHSVWAISDKIDITAGLRIEHTRYDYTNNTDSGLQGRLYRPASRSDNFTDISPKLAVSFAVRDNQRLFINLARAARAPQVTDLYRLRDGDKAGPLVPSPSALKSETLDSLEIGYRGSYRDFGQDLSFEVNLFAMSKRNHHFRDADDLYVTNGKTEHYGIEAEIDWQHTNPWGVWDIAANVSFAEHRYAFDRNVNRQVGENIADGNRIDSAPRWLAGAKIGWQPLDNLNTSLQWNYVGSYYIDAANTAAYKGHQLLDWQIQYTPLANTTLKAQVKNIADVAYATRADKWFGNNRYFPGEGRRFTLSLTQKF